MLAKTPVPRNGHIRVTFVLPEPGASAVHLVGDFSDWQAFKAMRRQKNGTWKTEILLEPGHEYGFRYLIDGKRWENDPKADKYVPNPYGSENSVVVT
ncbi:MAG: isoamylase early set domain-containing protein [Gemmatimonadales bacterium]|jgi:1,4-alpha-glucan branching enzyme